MWTAPECGDVASSGRAAHHRSDHPGSHPLWRRDRTFHKRRGVPRPSSTVDASTRSSGVHLWGGRTHPGCRAPREPAALSVRDRLDRGNVLRGDLPGQHLSVHHRDGCLRTRFGRFTVRAAPLPAPARGVGLVVYLCVVTLASSTHRGFRWVAIVLRSADSFGYYRGRVSNPTPLPKIGAPASRALQSAGYRSVEDLHGASRTMLLTLHGVGPRAIQLLEEAMAANAMSLAD